MMRGMSADTGEGSVGEHALRLGRVTRALVRRSIRRLRRVVRSNPVQRLPTAPLSRSWGFPGQSVVRRYIGEFLGEYADDIRGRVLEAAPEMYTHAFGGAAVTTSDVLHVTGAPGATVVGDLATGAGIPRGAFDAIVLTQVLEFIYEVEDAVATLHDALAPDGVLLLTVPGIGQIDRYWADRGGDYWRFTAYSLERLLQGRFGAENVVVRSYGNVKTATAFLYGLAHEELAAADFAVDDPDYPVVVAGRAVRR
jgi:SAM-dependent methyltransferase